MAAESAIARPKTRPAGPLTIAGAVLALLGFGAVLLLSSASHGSSGPAVATEDEVVAARDITARATITASDVVVKRVASDSVVPNAYQRKDQVSGLVPQVNITKGQPLSANVLAKSADAIPAGQTGYLPIPKGVVAVTIPTNEQQGVAGFVQSGDYISVIAVNGHGATRTVFTNVHVLRVGPLSPDVQPAGGGASASLPAQKPSGVSTSLSVVLTQCQAEFMTWFINNATLKYTLESYQDYSPSDSSVDQTCPGVSAAHGVTPADVNRAYPGFA